MTFCVGRRMFITLICGAAAAWPLAGRAEQPDRVRRIGVLMGQAAIDSEGQSRAAALRNVLQDLGWIDGRNVRFELRWFAGEPDRATVYARELVDLAPDVIVANTVPGLAAVARATRTIPTEFVAVTDPVGSGYVAGLAEPGGNITGFSTFDPPIGGKWLEALRQIAPATRKVAVIVDPDFVGFAAIWRAIPGRGTGIRGGGDPSGVSRRRGHRTCCHCSRGRAEPCPVVPENSIRRRFAR
jgi:putative tryptophan/tyrosine transport system substrate-binding protein